MEKPVKAALAVLLALAAPLAAAADNVLLIQLQAGGQYRVWHTEGDSQLDDDDVMTLEVNAKPEGGEELATAFGPARPYETPDGIVIRLPAAPHDKAVLVDRDGCGHIRLWHAAGTTKLSEDQITEVFMSALPEGGPRIVVGDYNVKAFIGKLGVTATLWHAKK